MPALDERLEAGPVTTDAPPFSCGDRVLFADCPCAGAMTVEHVERNKNGDWRVWWSAMDATGSCPAAHLALAPAGFIDPPLPPMRVALSPTGSYEIRADTVARMLMWRLQMRAWLERWGAL